MSERQSTARSRRTTNDAWFVLLLEMTSVSVTARGRVVEETQNSALHCVNRQYDVYERWRVHVLRIWESDMDSGCSLYGGGATSTSATESRSWSSSTAAMDSWDAKPLGSTAGGAMRRSEELERDGTYLSVRSGEKGG